jgi:DNA-binding transcriptional MerR regulator
MKIGELAKLSGIQTVTIRFYEKEGLLSAPDRTGSNYRLYGEKDFERLRFIKHCRQHGMGLSDIRQLLSCKDNPQKDSGWVKMLVENHVAKVQQQIDSLILLKGQLGELLDSGNETAGMGIIESLNNGDNCPDCKEHRRVVGMDVKRK